MIRKTVLALVALLLLPGFGWSQTIKIQGKTMGPIDYTVVIAPLPEDVEQEVAAKHVQDALNLVNQTMSTYIPDSEVSRFNRESNTDWIAVSAETAAVVARALEISKETEGAFDITVGPLVDLWKFGKDKSNFEVPTQSRIDEVKSSIGYKNLEVRLDPPSIRKLVPEIQIDLSAIAKGYAVDQVAASIRQLGCSNFMVEVGGEVRTAGKKENGEPWNIGIEVPNSEAVRDYKKFAKLNDASMATSGNYRNFYEVGGKTYSHTIDPNTGAPVTHQLASISIIADDCMSADAYATAGMVLGPELGKKCFDRLGLPHYMLVRKNSEFEEQSSKSFPIFSVENKTRSEASSSSIIPMFIGAVVIFGLAIVGMALGAIFNNKPITGSCGGLSAQNGGDGNTSCSICRKPTADCPDLNTESAETAG